MVVGAGPVGCVLAILLRRRGHEVELFEKRPDMRRTDITAGRSINLVLTERGLRGLERAGLRDALLQRTVPVFGRMMHSVEGELTYQPYGKDESECNYSISRGELNRFLLSRAEEAGAVVHFGSRFVDADFNRCNLIFEDNETQRVTKVVSGLVFGCDGAPSGVREALVRHHRFEARLDPLPIHYKELLFPAGPNDCFAMEKNALHIWPRGHHMLMALPNLDGSFTGTLYLPAYGELSFDALSDASSVQAYFLAHHPDAVPLLEDVSSPILGHPTGHLGTVYCSPWHLNGRVLLLGDAAHGIVPFFGQGLNCGFEDCLVFDDILDAAGDDIETAFAAFYGNRKPDADAIATMALENFHEMSDKVGDPSFLLRRKVASLLEKSYPTQFRTRYAMVMYSSIPYAAALEAGHAQTRLLDALCEGLTSPDHLDLQQARRLIGELYTPTLTRLGIDLARTMPP